MADQLDGLTDDHCRWVYGDPQGTWHFCRKPRARHPVGPLHNVYMQGRWCEEHRRITMQTGQEYFKKKSAA